MTTDSTIEDIARTTARFRKAVRMADILEAEGVTAQQATFMEPHHWELVTKAARLDTSSIVTRALVTEVLRDRELRRKRD